MNFFEMSYDHGGEEGVVNFERELDILTWTVRHDPFWPIATTSPLLDFETKKKNA